MRGSTPPIIEIEAVVFDYGAVLCHPPSEAQVSKFAALAGMPATRFRELYAQTRGPYDRGVISTEEYWLMFGQAAAREYSGDQIDLLAVMDQLVWSHLDHRMIDLAGRLHDRGIKTGILSNMQPDFRESLRSGVEWLEAFDVHIFSCDFKLIKPEPEIYQRLVEALGVPPQRTLFIDDMPVNIDAARQAGIEGVIYRSFDELADFLNPLFTTRHGDDTLESV
jgi:putative hydrolase of the HAD superfamily